MISYLSASYVYPVTSGPIKNGVVGVEEDGKITAVFTAEDAAERQIQDVVTYDGILVPGFVNTHCHLELSHMKAKIAGKKGLVDFVKNVMKTRSADDYSIEVDMLKADVEMFEGGIVAVGDISNQAISASIKKGSPIYYHTFLEVMGFNPATAKLSMDRALEFEEKFEDLSLSIVPHAPYSVSSALFDALKANSVDKASLVSIHNQETADENAFFEDKTGSFLDLYEFLGLNIDFYKPSGKTSLQTYLPLLSPDNKTLLVHNTFTSMEDVKFAEAVHPNLYWCLCPRANMYIEDRLPDVNMLKDAGVRITLGTDSLASNRKLSILAEMEVLANNFDIPMWDLIKWATWNGADFLGVTERYGSLEPGKRPGINLLGYKEKNEEAVLNFKMKRLF
ncbi:amidohydrolase family protein [Pedobacter frigoris]|uniref:Amidohydrolase n=1 Tax=Pedobacter frigoris TaxID=2571272 RepID=A0A4U1CBP8_9SPHI|nr:amidohydrolase family protein [Pedobacter frigoris]TKC04149.1 amidohydrolase [Pedobacter frigoris]